MSLSSSTILPLVTMRRSTAFTSASLPRKSDSALSKRNCRHGAHCQLPRSASIERIAQSDSALSKRNAGQHLTVSCRTQDGTKKNAVPALGAKQVQVRLGAPTLIHEHGCTMLMNNHATPQHLGLMLGPGSQQQYDKGKNPKHGCINLLTSKSMPSCSQAPDPRAVP